jgi:hypothetical protein
VSQPPSDQGDYAYYNGNTRVRVLDRRTLGSEECVLVEWPNADADPDGIASRSWVEADRLVALDERQADD